MPHLISLLYMQIFKPHKLKSLMLELIIFCFYGGDKEFIVIIENGATCNNDQRKYRLSFNKTSLNVAINYLLDNCSLTLGSTCLGQLIEIPVGSDSAPFYICIIMKGSCFFKQKNGISKRIKYFQIFLGL